MTAPLPYALLSPETLSRWLEEEKPFYLLHTLTEDHYTKIRLPRALRASVFEINFLEQVEGATRDPEAVIVLYGSSHRSMDADTAARKLHRAGYRRLHVLSGGLSAWNEKGLPLEGSSPEVVHAPQRTLTIPDGTYRIDTEESSILWVGRNPASRHHGQVRLASGSVDAKGGTVTGHFDIDMNTIANINLEGDELQQVLEDHLKSDDFFFTRRFPVARFTMEDAAPVPEPFLSVPNCKVRGQLELGGVTAPLAFPATVTPTDEGHLAAEAHFDLDRTRWKVIYGSSKFFEHLGMHLVFDLISFEIRIKAQKSQT
ncbi:YceI family protein [Desulfoluna spongiiphila]|uniref:YceI family protein n=1 Tax=Desulfoluna spongiiphila TaxID=419481 RepID=UPI0012522CDA|nr:YceI family protein [Desulfoluna spongiiphila]VVS94999.1 lipid/polyisoprenoid-binding ycei-like [Desulfoluna spongiiphila]